jgi:hypothetical protein
LIGVTGHRTLADDSGVADQVACAIELILSELPPTANTPVLLGVVSPLAEGADRIVAHAVLDSPEGVLEVPLPGPKEVYARDFVTTTSRNDFEKLLAHAVRVKHVGPADVTSLTDESYLRAGREVAARCDAMIAIWDGDETPKTGGTAEIVNLACGAVPVYCISPSGDMPPDRVNELPIDTTELLDLEHYNAQRVQDRTFRRDLSRWKSTCASADPLAADYADWIGPFFVRADAIATRFGRQFRVALTCAGLLAFFAVSTVTTGTMFPSLNTAGAWAEFALLILLGFLVYAARYRWHLQRRWITTRILAERLRAAYLLAVSGVPRGPGALERSLERTDRSTGERSPLEWVARSYTEVWDRRPFRIATIDEGTTDSHTPTPSTSGHEFRERRELARNWMKDQVEYHRDKSSQYTSQRLRLDGTILVLFLCSVAVAFVHALALFEEESIAARLLVVGAILVPAFISLLGAIEVEREYKLLAKRYTNISAYLSTIRDSLLAAQALDTVRRAAADAENLVTRENETWYSIMEFHDLEAK